MEASVAPRKKRLTRAERQAETRDRLLDAGAEVIGRRGFQGASVEEISMEAGFTRGAFYSNFESKEQLFVELLQKRAYEEYTRMLEGTNRQTTPREQMKGAADQLVERYRRADEDPKLLGLLLECLAEATRNERLRELASVFWKGNRAIVAERFRAEYERRGAKLPIAAEHLASAMTALDIGLVLQHFVDPDEVPLEVYPPLYDLLFGDLVEPQTED